MKRYTVESVDWAMKEYPDGEWLKWRDHERAMYNHEVENEKLTDEIQDRMAEICILTQNADALNAEIVRLKAGLRSANDVLSTYHDRPTNITVEIGGKEFHSKVAEICDELRVKMARRRVGAHRSMSIPVTCEPDCNCKEMATGEMVEYPHIIMKDWWICPKHGYKKR